MGKKERVTSAIYKAIDDVIQRYLRTDKVDPQGER